MQDYLDKLLNLKIRILADQIFYRARIINSEDYGELILEGEDKSKFQTGFWGFPQKMMGSPPKGKAKPGRANSHLYLASLAELACSEVRPITTDFISVISFKNSVSLNLIDLTRSNLDIFELKEQTEMKEIIKYIQFAFSLPCKEQSKKAYACSQEIAKFIKDNGFDGIKYCSANQLEEGYNCVLFDPQKAEPTQEKGRIFKLILLEQTYQNLSLSNDSIKKVVSSTNSEQTEEEIQRTKFKILFHNNSKKESRQNKAN